MNNSKETFKLFQSARVQNVHAQKLQSTLHHISVLVIFFVNANPWSEHPGSGICGVFF